MIMWKVVVGKTHFSAAKIIHLEANEKLSLIDTVIIYSGSRSKNTCPRHICAAMF